MFKSTRTSTSRALFLLVILASVIAFRCGWFVRGARGISTFPDGLAAPKRGNDSRGPGWNTKFAQVYSEAKSKGLVNKISNPPWYAGEYYRDDPKPGEEWRKSSIVITHGQEYFSEAEICCGMGGPLNFGTVKPIGDGRLDLCPKYRGRPGGDECWKVSIVRWGDRQYLVSDLELESFLGAVESGIEPRKSAYGKFFMRNGDWSKEVTTSPIIPKSAKAMRLP